MAPPPLLPGPASRPEALSARLRRLARNWRQEVALALTGAPAFACPCCGFRGRFLPVRQPSGLRPHAACPRCGALERHRLQRLVLDRLYPGATTSAGAVLHMAPEPAIRRWLEPRSRRYLPADLEPAGDRMAADLRALPFRDGSFDLVFASHVLEHVDDDRTALREIRRVLRPGGIAILPVPIVAARTVEYPHPVAAEHFHVRAPGPDYFDRYRGVFDRVAVYGSADFPVRHQLYIHEDRSRFPAADAPFRPAMDGDRHGDHVPVCHVERSPAKAA